MKEGGRRDDFGLPVKRLARYASLALVGDCEKDALSPRPVRRPNGSDSHGVERQHWKVSG